MNQGGNNADDFQFDEPWKPVSYFEEEDEATGGHASEAAYSPTRLASLFESNISAFELDIERSKKYKPSSENNTESSSDLDDLNEYMLETESGINVLDTTYSINQKAIFHDFDRLRHWQQSIEKTDRDVYINEENSVDKYTYKISNDQLKDSEHFDEDIDTATKSNEENNLSIDAVMERLKELENQLNEEDDKEKTQIMNSDHLQLNNKPMTEDMTAELNTKQFIHLPTDDLLTLPDVSNQFSGINDDFNDLKLVAEDTEPDGDFIEYIEKKLCDKQSDLDRNIVVDSCTANIISSHDTTEVDELVDIAENIVNVLSAEENNSTMTENQITEQLNKNEICALLDIHDTPMSDLMQEVPNSINSTLPLHATHTSINNALPLHAGSTLTESLHEVSTSINVTIPHCGAATNNNVPEVTAPVHVLTEVALSPLINADINDIEYTSSINIQEQICGESDVTSTESIGTLQTIETFCKTIDIQEGPGTLLTSGTHENSEATQLSVVAVSVDEQSEPELNSVSSKIDESTIPSTDSTEHNFSKQKSSADISSVRRKDLMQCLTPDEDDDIITNTVSHSDNENVSSSHDILISGENSFENDNFVQAHTEISHNAHKMLCNTTRSIDNPQGTELSGMSDTSSVPKESMRIVKAVVIGNSSLSAASNSIVGFSSTVSSEHSNEHLDKLLDTLEEELIGTNDVTEDVTSSTVLDDTTVTATLNNSTDIVTMTEAPKTSYNDPTMETSDVRNVEGLDTESTMSSSETRNMVASSNTLKYNEIVTTTENLNKITGMSPSILPITDVTSNTRPDMVLSLEEDTTVLHEAPLSVLDVESENVDTVSTLNENIPSEANNTQELTTTFDTEIVPTDSDIHAASAEITNDGEHAEETPSSLATRLPRSGSSLRRRVRFSLDDDPRTRSTHNQETSTSTTTADEPYSQPIDLEGATSSELSQVSGITDEMKYLGWFAPKWIPDVDTKTCMKCDVKFTVVKRRHHCRACGKVLCGQCCNMKFHLPYLDYKPARVCQTCCDVMVTVMSSQSAGELQPPNLNQPSLPNLPEAPPPYSEAIDGHSERLGSNASDAPPYTEVPAAANGTRFSEQPAPVLPAGQALEILPNMRPSGRSPVSNLVNFQSMAAALPAYSVRQRQTRSRSESEMSAVIMFNSTATNLPPILQRYNDETRIVNSPDLDTLYNQMKDERGEPISFIVNKNLVVRVQVVNMDCCIEKKCWCFVSDGMGASNQEEIVILIKYESLCSEEVAITRKVLQQMNAIFEKAKHGHPVSDLEQMSFDSSMCCTPKNVGMLFFKPTLQCIKKLFLPTSPYLFGLYIERSEVPWAKNFPLRLLLRIGAEFKYYPCPLFNVLDRLPVYDGVGRTILDLLADFRNFQYSLPRIIGVTINLRGKDTIVRLPQHRYDEVLKAVNSAEENVLSLAGNFSSTCDGHLVSVEKDGRYKTQTLSIVLKENRKVTCASFIVISAALKPNQEGIKAKASIVEDGVMVQVTADVMKEFKNAIKEMKEFTITAGNPTAGDCSQVGIEWCSSDIAERPRLLSPIDATSFDNLTNMKIRHSYDYTSNNLTAKIHWVEVYFLPQDNDTVQRLSARELGQMTSSIAKACMSALSPHLMTLIALEMTRIGLRINLASDFVEYKIGANLSTLPAELLPTLDDKLVPAIHSVMSSAQERVAVELIFQVVKIV